MSIFKRLFKIGQAEANSAVDKLEDPIKMTEQGIRDMKSELEKSLHGLAEIKAMAIRAGNEINENRIKAEEYEQKAMKLVQQSHKGLLAPAEADRLATEALVKREDCHKNAVLAAENKEKLEKSALQMEGNINTLKNTISKWENELKTLKARVKVSAATQELNKQLASLDVSGTAALLDRMKEKVAQQEALAESYGQLAESNKSVDQEIDKALEGAFRLEAGKALDALKLKMGVIENSGKSDEQKLIP